jgi:GT2 family glycosyltransferase
MTEALIAVLQDRADVACVGPKVLSPDGTEQLPFDKPIPIGTAMWHNVAFPFLRGRPPWETAYKLRPGTSVGQYCYWVSGCFLMSRAADFVAAGMFDEETFLYGEEVILSERLRPRERHFYYEPSLEIRHHCGKTISRYLQNPALARIDLASSLHYYRTYRRANAALILLFRCCGAIRLLWVRLAYARYERRRARALRAEEARSAP